MHGNGAAARVQAALVAKGEHTWKHARALVISHTVTLCILLSTAILAFPTAETADAWITPERIGIVLACLHAVAPVRATRGV